MAKLVVQHDVDPGIAIVVEELTSLSAGWSGRCTECGEVITGWDQYTAVRRSKAHVDQHESGL